MDGFDVRPVRDLSRTYPSIVPSLTASRVMLSSQRLWPASWSSWVALISIPSGRCSAVFLELGLGLLGQSPPPRLDQLLRLRRPPRALRVRMKLRWVVED